MTSRKQIDALVQSVKQTRDEVRLKMHLANAEIKDEWNRLEDKFQRMNAQYEPVRRETRRAADDVWTSIRLVGEELQDGFNRIRNSF